VPAQFVLGCANETVRIEQWLDDGARSLGIGAFSLANAESRAEAGFDSTGREFAIKTSRLAALVDLMERQGFSVKVNRGAALLILAGNRLRDLQSGKLYLYTLGVVLWVFFTGVLGFLAWHYPG
jgi:NADH-quinone oxidoreductase subunit L